MDLDHCHISEANLLKRAAITCYIRYLTKKQIQMNTTFRQTGHRPQLAWSSINMCKAVHRIGPHYQKGPKNPFLYLFDLLFQLLQIHIYYFTRE